MAVLEVKVPQLSLIHIYAHDPVKETADFVTKSVDEDGVIHALRHFGVLE